MEVLNGCHFITYSTEQEKEERADMLLTLASSYEKECYYEESFMCLQEAINGLPTHYYKRAVKIISTTLSSSTLNNELMKKSLAIIEVLLSLNTPPISNDAFTSLINHLINEGEGGKIKELVKSAISSDWYQSVCDINPNSIIFSSLLSPLEVHVIIREHLLQHSPIQDFELVCLSSKCIISPLYINVCC